LLVIGEVACGLQAVEKAEELRPDLILLDIGLPSLSGIEAARRIRNNAPQQNILFVTNQIASEIVREALELGASGYIAKSDARRDLLAGIDAAVRGERFVSSSLSSPDSRRFH
jgi:DNA-binding NarL/FixJ family response regulator